MLWRIKATLDSVKYRAEKDIRETLLKNRNFKNNKWSSLERLVTWGSKNTIKATAIIATTYAVATSLISKNYHELKEILPRPINSLDKVIEIQGTLLGTQATLVGLIFPLVIAFIGILLQGKSSNKAMWAIYKDCSGFMLVGFSSLTLILSSTITNSISPWLEPHTISAASYVLTGWFLFNLFLSGWFLWKTIQFLHNEERMNMVLKYSINEVMKNDIRNRLEAHHGNSALLKELCESTKENNLKVKPYTLEELPTKVNKISDNQVVSNILLRPIRLGISILNIQSKISEDKKNGHTLCFSIKINDKGHPDIKIAETSLPKANLLSKAIIKSSIRTSKIKPSKSLSVAEIVSALFGQLEDSLKENNSNQFQQSRDELIKFQKEIEKSCQFTNDQGEPDNWLLLPEARFFGKDFLFTFIVEGTNVSSLVTSRIQQDNSYYESWCYFYLGLFASENSARPKKIGQEYIVGHYFIWVKLMEWISGNDSESSHKDNNEDRAIKHFIGSWESWKNRIGKDDATISDSEYWYKITHLERTSHMAITSIKHKNIEAAKWAIDALIYWEDEFIEIHKLVNYYMWRSAIITPDLMQGISEDLKEIIAGKNNFNEIEAATISLLNYWTDMRCLTAAYIISLTGYIDKRNLKEFLNHIIEAKRTMPSGHINKTSNAINNASELIGIYLRQNGSWNTQNHYKERLEKHIENLARIQEPAWVSGRVYSFDGNTRDQYLPAFFIIYGIGLSTREFSISRDWQSFLNSCSIVEKENLINSLSCLKNTTEEMEEKTIDLFDIDHEEFKSRKSSFEKSINDLINHLKEDTTRSIIESDVDEDILRNYSSYASENNFSKEKGPIPLSMFDKVFYTSASEVTLRTFKITNFDKSNIGRGLEVNRAINEKEWINKVMRQRIQLDTFRKLIMGTSWTNHEAKSANEIIEHAVNDGRSIIKSGKTPILFIGPWSVFKKIDSSKWNYTPKSERLPYEIKVESGMPESYICHVDGIETHRLPFSRSPECFLTPKENMEYLEIAEFNEGTYVNVAFEESEDDPLTGTLLLRYSIEPKIGIEKGHRYILSDAED